MAKGVSLLFRTTVVHWLILVHLTPATAFAEDDLSIVQYIPNYLSVDYGLDNDHGRDMFILANLGLTLKDRMLFGIGRQTQTVSRSEETLDNKTYLLGYNYLPYSLTQIGVEYEYWGDSDKVTIDSFRIVLAFNAGNFAIMLTPEFRKINVNNDSQCDDQIDSGSARLNLSIDVGENYTVNTSYVSYDYSDNLTELGNCVSSSEQLEVESRIDSVADDTQIAVGLDYYADNESYGTSLSRAKTALFSQNYETLSFYVSTERFDDWTLTATAGITENTDDSSTLFVTGTITYYW